MKTSPLHSGSYISSHFSMGILCISIGQPNSEALKISELTSCPEKYKKKKYEFRMLYQKKKMVVRGVKFGDIFFFST